MYNEEHRSLLGLMRVNTKTTFRLDQYTTTLIYSIYRVIKVAAILEKKKQTCTKQKYVIGLLMHHEVLKLQVQDCGK